MLLSYNLNGMTRMLLNIDLGLRILIVLGIWSLVTKLPSNMKPLRIYLDFNRGFSIDFYTFFIASDYMLKLYFFSLQHVSEHIRFGYLYLITVMKTDFSLGLSNAAIRIIRYVTNKCYQNPKFQRHPPVGIAFASFGQ